MKYIGKLDREKLKDLRLVITTEEVIITSERIRHIKARHPCDYEIYKESLKDIIEIPDYICKDKNNEDTIFMMKSIQSKNVQLVIKLQTNPKIKSKKNSILTFWSIRKRNYEKVLKSNEIIYRSIDERE